MDKTSDKYHFHPRTDVDGRSVDKGMADLMRVVWEYGIRTVSCCQGGPESPFGWAWIQFWELPEAMKFLEATAYLANYTYGDDLHLYLTPPILPQAGPSPMVLMNHELLPQITKIWSEGTANKVQSSDEIAKEFFHEE
jgi:hypothetical protein